MTSLMMAVDSNVIAGATQAIATVAAVLVGYGLSVLNERQTRQHLDDSGRRERRLSVIIDLIDALSTVRDATRAVTGQLATYFAMEGGSATGLASRQAALTAARRLAEGEFAASHAAAQRVNRLVLATTILGLPADVGEAAKVAGREVEGLIDDLEAALKGVDISADRLRSHIMALDACIDGLISLGKGLG